MEVQQFFDKQAVVAFDHPVAFRVCAASSDRAAFSRNEDVNLLPGNGTEARPPCRFPLMKEYFAAQGETMTDTGSEVFSAVVGRSIGQVGPSALLGGSSPAGYRAVTGQYLLPDAGISAATTTPAGVFCAYASCS
ncbi:hypothetical protein [Rhodococcus globerulus]|nr:hypothetical protein [Rhodococcus globerulus]NMD59425.1 hypothetical protein [Nocardia globerula]